MTRTTTELAHTYLNYRITSWKDVELRQITRTSVNVDEGISVAVGLAFMTRQSRTRDDKHYATTIKSLEVRCQLCPDGNRRRVWRRPGLPTVGDNLAPNSVEQHPGTLSAYALVSDSFPCQRWTVEFSVYSSNDDNPS
ncbi:hypothetical protein TNCV_1471651 [Trichonephila clavipes]|nr:hypothetical protein TNCV_1471651 [Trichonephila clavipes]